MSASRASFLGLESLRQLRRERYADRGDAVQCLDWSYSTELDHCAMTSVWQRVGALWLSESDSNRNAHTT